MKMEMEMGMEGELTADRQLLYTRLERAAGAAMARRRRGQHDCGCGC